MNPDENPVMLNPERPAGERWVLVVERAAGNGLEPNTPMNETLRNLIQSGGPFLVQWEIQYPHGAAWPSEPA